MAETNPAPAKSTRVHQIKKVNNPDGSVTFNRADTGKPIVSIKWTDVPPALHAQAHTFFLREKFGNFYAGAKNVEKAIEALSEGLKRIKSGVWVERGESLVHDSMVLSAVANIYCKGDMEDAKRRKAKATPDQWKAVIGSPKVKAEQARMVAARAADHAKEAGDVPMPALPA